MPHRRLKTLALAVLAASAAAFAAPAFTSPACPDSPEGVTLIADVAYLDGGRQEKMDIYLPVERKAGQRSPANLHDCKNAVRFLRVNADRYGVDPGKIGVMGNLTGVSVNTPGLFDPTRQQDPGLWRLASPVSYVRKGSPPTLILHGLADATVDCEQAKELAAKLAEHGVEHRLVLLGNVGHTFYLKTWKNKPLPVDVEAIVLEFLARHLK